MDLGFQTPDMTYGKYNFFLKYCETLHKEPNLACVTDHPSLEHKCEDLSKAIFAIFYL